MTSDTCSGTSTDAVRDERKTSIQTGNARTGTSPDRLDVAAEWRHWLTGLTLALLFFEIVTGLSIYLLKFSVFNQFSVLWHTAVGVAMIVPIGWYLARHWWLRFRGRFNHYQLLGYVTAGLLIALFVSGYVLTWQAAFATRMGYVWDQVHLVTGIAFVFAVLAHTIMLWIRKVNAPDQIVALRRGKRSFAFQCVCCTLVLFGILGGSAALYAPAPINNEFPADYSWKYGVERPFAPSLVRTVSNRAYDPTTLNGSRSCGSDGCHDDILEEWTPSAHRYASSDVAFQAVQKIMYA